MRICCIVVCLLLAIASHAQKTEHRAIRKAAYRESYLGGKLFAKISLSGFLDPVTPTAQVGLEYRINEKLGAEFSIGIPVNVNYDSADNDHYKLKAELKFYPTRQFLYISSELFFVSHYTRAINGRFIGEDDRDYSFDEGTLNRKAGGITFKLGGALVMSNRLHMDGSFGLGLRYQNVKVHATNIRQEAFSGWELNKKQHRQGSNFGSHLTIGIKFGYLLSRRSTDFHAERTL